MIFDLGETGLMGSSDDDFKSPLERRVIREGQLLLSSQAPVQFAHTLRQLKENYKERIVKENFQSVEKIKVKLEELEGAFQKLSRIRRLYKPDQKENENTLLAETAKKFFKGKQYAKAFSYFEADIETHGETMERLLLAASSALFAKQYLKAESHADRILQLNSLEAHGYVIKAFACRARYQPEKALIFFKNALRLDPKKKFLRAHIKELQGIVKSLSLQQDPKNPYACKRRWPRVSVDLPLYAKNTSNAEVLELRVISLSAGGALVQHFGSEPFPEVIDFCFELSPTYKICGRAFRLYDKGSGQIGVRFEGFNAGIEEQINKAVVSLIAA